MAIPNSVKQELADQWATGSKWIAVFTGAGGGTTGANEATGGGYGRQQTTLTTGSDGTTTGSEVEIPVAAGTYTEAGAFSAQTAGNFRGSAPFTDGSVSVSGNGASIKVTPTFKMNNSS